MAASPEPPKIIALHPASVKRYLDELARLDELINEDLSHGDHVLANWLRDLIDAVVVIPSPAGTPAEIEIRGHLAMLINDTAFVKGSYSGGQWCRRRDLNPRPPAYEADALPLSYAGHRRGFSKLLRG